jgi:serine/threonine protein kinase
MFYGPWIYQIYDFNQLVVNVKGVMISDNRAASGSGGGLLMVDYSPLAAISVSGGEIVRNSASAGGGGVYATSVWSDITVKNVKISNNSAAVGAGGFEAHFSVKLSLMNVSVIGNHGPGIVFTDEIILGQNAYELGGSELYVSGSKFIDNVNEMDGWGGGMLLRGGVMAKVTRCDFEGNRARNGGAVAVVGQGGLDLLDVAIRSNEARECGGGVAFTSLTSLSYGQNLILESNRGLYGGGMCYMPPSAAGVSTVCYPPGAPTHLGLSASSSLAASPASLGVVRLSGNVADASGGGLYLRCKGLPEVIKDAVMDGGAGGRRLETGDVERRARNSNMSSSLVGQRRVQQASFSLNGVSYEMSDNVARYGESIGSIQEKMSMLGWDQATSISFVPGDALLKEIVLTDGFGQVIKTKEGIVVAEMLVMGEDGGFTVHHRHFYEFDDDGRCLLDQEAAWPLKNGQGTEFMDSAWLKLRYQPGIVETDGSMLSGSTTDLSLSMQVIPLERLSCMEGTSFTRVQGGSGVCVACQRDQYVVSPDYSPCMQCAIGGECDGSNLKGLLEGSKWTREGQEMRLVECPPGSIIVRDTIAVLDECIVCPQQTFSNVTARWEQGKGQLVSQSASQASLLCTTCLPHRKCQGSQNLPLDTRIWITPKGEAGPGPEQLESLEASAGECFEKMAECDTLRQRETVVISIADAGAGPTRFTVQWREIDDGGPSGRSIDAQPSVVQQGGSNLMYVAEFTPSKVGNYLIEILRNGISLPNSPILLRVEQALCPTFQTADDQGICRCSGYETEALGCIGSDTLIAIIIVPVIFLLLLVACIFTKYSIDQADKVWQIEKSEITFADDPPTVLGKGVHGQVLLGEYRGTACAVKTIVPERTESRGDVKKSSGSSRSQAQSPTNNHSTNLHLQQQHQHQHHHQHHHQRVETDVRGLAASDQNNAMPPFGARPDKDEDYDDYDDDDDAVDRFGQKIVISRTASGSSMQSSSHAHPSDNQGARHPVLQCGHSQSSDLTSGSSHAKKSVNQNQHHGMDSALEMTLDEVSGSHGAFGRPHNGTMDDKQVSASKRWLQSKVWRAKSRLRLWVNNRASRMLAKLGHKKSTEHVSRVDALLAEMRVLIKLRHPNITTIMGAVVNDVEFPWLVMEYMQKGSLLSLLKSEDVHLDNKHLIKLAADIVHGMRFLHASSPPIIHGDLKCANVLVDSAFHAKVTDFGYAKQMKQPGKVVGSPFFMAPELLTGGHWHSCASDVYAFGIMLYEMFAQQPLYPGPGDVISILRQVIHQDRRPILPPRLQNLDRDDPLKSIVSMMTQCWEKEVSKRPTFEEMDKCSTLADHMGIATTSTPAITPIQSGLGDKTLMMSQRSEAHPRSPVGRANSRSAVAIKGPVVPPRIMEALMRGEAVGPEHHVCVSLIWLDASAAFEDLASFFETLHAAAARFDVFLVGNTGEGGDGVVAVSNMHKKQDDHALRIAAFAISLREEAKMPKLFKASVSAGPLSAAVAYTDRLGYVINGKALLWAQDIAQFGLEGQIVCLPDFQEAASHQVHPKSTPMPSSLSLISKHIHRFTATTDGNPQRH